MGIGACNQAHRTISARILSTDQVLSDPNSCSPQPGLLFGEYDVPPTSFVIVPFAICVRQEHRGQHKAKRYPKPKGVQR